MSLDTPAPGRVTLTGPATYVATIVGLSALAFIWIDAFNDLPTFLGLLSAGIAIALASKGFLALEDGIALALGANIGRDDELNPARR